MRLTNHAKTVIHNTAIEVFGTNISVSLFGSRIDDSARGGDIDLLIQSEELIADCHRKTLQLVAKLQIRLGDQPIDVLTIDPQTAKHAVHEEALRTAIKL